MTETQRSRARAAELDEVAKRFDRPEHREDCQRMAASWRQLADRLEAGETELQLSP